MRTDQVKLSKQRIPNVMIRGETLNALKTLAPQIGKTVPGLAADILEAASEMKPENFYLALAALQREGRK